MTTTFVPKEAKLHYDRGAREQAVTLDMPMTTFIPFERSGVCVERIKVEEVWYADEAAPQMHVLLYGRALTTAGKPDKRQGFASQYLNLPVLDSDIEAVMAHLGHIGMEVFTGDEGEREVSFGWHVVRQFLLDHQAFMRRSFDQ